jgi:predicted GNAT family acetyltransferase
MNDESVASRETSETTGGADQVRLWLDAIAIASDEEEIWRRRAEDTIKIYRAGGEIRPETKRDRTFNILHSNVETIVPAIYNTPPIPDVRRRYGDDDPAGDEVCDIIERALSYSIDTYDFDATVRAAAKDMELCGRAVARARYVPYFGPEGELADEDVTCEIGQWQNFRRGPGKTWVDVPWIAFELFLTREQLTALSKEGAKVELDCEIDGFKAKGDGSNPPEIFKRARVWEIWDKEKREVLFIAESMKDKPLLVEKDPLGLSGFFPIPRPLYAIDTSDNLIPVIPYDVYRDQAEELEEVSRRIQGCIQAIRAAGVYDGRLAEIGRLVDASDGDLVPVENASNYAEGGLERAITWWPIEAISKTLEKLYVQRDQIKQTIYETTGLSDIMRGQGADRQVTATEQDIKQQWGSLRVQRKQAEVARFARDLFRIKAEIIASKFSWETITKMCGIEYATEQEKQQLQQIAQAVQQGLMPPPPPEEIDRGMKLMKRPSREKVEGLLRNDTMRGFSIDVESNSTIRADLSRTQKEMATFMQGVGEFAKTIGPGVAQGFVPAHVAAEVFGAFARNFRLGKQAEDAIERFSDEMRDNPPPQQEDPKVALERERMAADEKKNAQDAAFKERELVLKEQIADREAVREQQIAEREIIIKENEAALKARIVAFEAEVDAEAVRKKTEADIIARAQEARQKQQIAANEAIQKQELMRQQADQQAQIRAAQAASDDMRKSQALQNDEKRKAKMFQADEKRRIEPRKMKASVQRGGDGKISGLEIS